MSDHKGARLIVDDLPDADHLIADQGYASNWFCEALIVKGITPCIPPRSNRKVPDQYNKTLYKNHQKVENRHCRYRHILSQCISPEPR